MKRQRAGAAEGVRRARVETDSAQQVSDPIAAAAQAKKEREEARIKAAAQAAARAFAGKTKTVFFDSQPSVQADTSALHTNGKADTISSNPLASILGYEQEDSASEDGSEPPSPRTGTLSAADTIKPPADAPEVTAAANSEGDELDTELASFMSELESSGLLTDDSASASASPGPQADPQRADFPAHHVDSVPPAVSLSTDSATLANPAAAIVSAVQGATDTPTDATADGADQSHESSASQSAADAQLAGHDQLADKRTDAHVSESRPDADGSSTTADNQGSEPAEQRVLGELQGAPQWHEVMDMASGKVYFWDSTSDEVAWDPPAGTQPRSKQETSDTFAAHVSANSVTPNSQSTAAAESAASEAAASASAETAVPTAAAAAALQGSYSESASQEGSINSVPATEMPAEMAQHITAEQGDDIKAETSSGTASADQTVLPAASTSAQASQPTPATQSALTVAAETTVPSPSASVAALGTQTAKQVQAALLAFCPGIPHLIRLAVEAEVRQQDWQMFAAKQQTAADQGLPGGVLSWKDFQDHVQWRWHSMQAALPDAVAQAQELQGHRSQELEDGEMPPLPHEESLSSLSTPALTGTPPPDTGAEPPAAPTGTLSASAGELPAIPDDQPSLPSDPPPLPPGDPYLKSEIAGTARQASSMQDSAAQQASAPGGLQQAAQTAAEDVAGPSSDADMDVDMDVDAGEAGQGTSERPGSAEALPSSSGSQLPDWAGFHMNPGHIYPYYGQSATTAATAQSPSMPTGTAVTSEAADFLASQPAAPMGTPGSSSPATPAAAPAGATGVPTSIPVARKREYKAAPAPSVPAPAEDTTQAAAAPAAGTTALPTLPAVAAETEQKKRKRPKAPVSSSKPVKKGKSSRGLNLVDKWQAVRKDLEDQEAKAEEEMFPDAAAVERKRAQQAEKWRLQQLKEGTAAEDNANFQPLAVDWRAKLKGKASDTSDPAATSSLSITAGAGTSPAASATDLAASVTADGKPDLDGLSKGLPAGWRAMWDKNSGDIYYGNLKTRETAWDRPG